MVEPPPATTAQGPPPRRRVRVLRFRLCRPLTDRLPCLRGRWNNGLPYSVRLSRHDDGTTNNNDMRRCATSAMGLALDCFVLCLGPVLICLASSIIVLLTMSFFNVFLPMLAPDGPWSPAWLFHVSVVLFLLVNVVFNYVACVCTRNGGEKYERVVRELARAMGYNYPEGPEEVERARIDYEQLILQRRRQRQRNYLSRAEGGVSQSPNGCHVVAAASPTPPQPRTTVEASVSDESSSFDGSSPSRGDAPAASTDGEEASTLLPAHPDGDDVGVGVAPAPGEVVQGAAATVNDQRNRRRGGHADDSSSSSPGGIGVLAGGGEGGGPKRRGPHHNRHPPPRRPAAVAAPSSPERPGVVHAWTLLRAHEWGFCNRSNQPKPPRSHYDHVTATLVLNMDHYCPWMFNTVGYFNYRYFCNFLLYVFLGTSYGFVVTYSPFRNLDSAPYRQQVQMSRDRGFETVQHLLPRVPTPNERMSVAFSFMLCLSVGVAVFCLMSFHAYLIFSAQTTIEFHANWPKRRWARQRGGVSINPYDLGPRRNWRQVYGTSPGFLAIMPSLREPEFLPVPLAGERGRRPLFDARPGSSSVHVNSSEQTDQDIAV